MDTGLSYILFAFAVMLCGALISFFMSLFRINNHVRGWTAFAFVFVASVIIVAVCGKVLMTGETLTGAFEVFKIEVMNASMHFCIDRLSAFFMILVVALAVPVTMFSIAYMEREEDIRGYYAPLILFVLGMLGVLCMDDLFYFFIPWEFMSLSAYTLILFDKKDPKALQAGLKYFIVTHIGTTCMFVGAIIIYYYPTAAQPSFLFPSISNSMSHMMVEHPNLLHLSLAFFFLGFATKTGLFPFGFWWLPDAHPAAPSPISSLLSGVMIKIGIYGFIRVFLFLLPMGQVSFTWGWVIALFGTASLFLGTLRAMMQHDSKVLLAYHSIGQVGYITLGLGLGMVFMEKAPLLAALAMCAGLYHLINHACFKGLLFLNAGAVIHKTGVRDMDKLGGMARLLPVTSVAAIIAVFSIAGLPGFNGFVSKWMLYQASIFGSMHYPLTILLGVAAVFISVVTLVSVLKFYTSMFSGHMPSVYRDLKRGEDATIQAPQVFLAIACILFGIVPALGIYPGFAIFSDLPALLPVGYEQTFGQYDLFQVTLFAESKTGTVASIGVWNPLLAVLVLAAFGIVASLIVRSMGAKTRTVDSWYCGSVVNSDEVIYRASSYYLYLKEFFRLIDKRLVPRMPELRTDLSKILNIDTWLFYPFSRATLWFCRFISRSHIGITHVYLLWTVVGAIITIIALFSMI